VVLAFLDSETIDNLSLFSTPEVSDEFLIILIVNRELSDFVVFKLRMILHFLRNTLASEEPDSLDL